MRDFIAKISLTALFVLAIFSASAAEKVTFEANSPLTVAVGEPFRVEFALNAQPEPGSFKAPSFEGFDVIAGPAEAQGQSIQIVNNSMTRVINYTITYVLVPQGAERYRRCGRGDGRGDYLPYQAAGDRGGG